MRDNVAAARGKRKLQNHIVVRVGKERPPEKMNLLQMRLTSEVAEKFQGIPR